MKSKYPFPQNEADKAAWAHLVNNIGEHAAFLAYSRFTDEEHEYPTVEEAGKLLAAETDIMEAAGEGESVMDFKLRGAKEAKDIDSLEKIFTEAMSANDPDVIAEENTGSSTFIVQYKIAKTRIDGDVMSSAKFRLMVRMIHNDGTPPSNWEPRLDARVRPANNRGDVVERFLYNYPSAELYDQKMRTDREAIQEKEKADKAEADRKLAENREKQLAADSRYWDYKTAIEKYKLPTGKKTPITVKTIATVGKKKKESTLDLVGTKIGDFYVGHPADPSMMSIAKRDSANKFDVTHIQSGRSVLTGLSLSDARRLVRVLLHAGVNTNFNDMPELSKDDRDRWIQAVQSFRTNETPEYFNKPPARKEYVKSEFDNFLDAGGEAYQVTQAKWISMNRAHRTALGQNADEGTRFAPDAGYVEFHKRSVEDTIAAGKPIEKEVLADYPDIIGKLAMQNMTYDHDTKIFRPMKKAEPVSETDNTGKSEEGKALSAYNDGSITVDELAARLEASTNSEISQAVKDYKKAVEDDRFEYGMRSGLPEEYGDKLISTVERFPNG